MVQAVEVPQFRFTINVSTEQLNILPTLDTQLGVGGQGVVYKGHWKTTKVAVKMMALNDKSKPHLEKEIEALSQLQHPNICALVGWYIRPVSNLLATAALVTEFYAGGELFHKVTKDQMSEHAIMNIFRQLFEAVFYMHSKDMIHCDIKLENIVLTSDETPKLIDFGLTNTCNAGTVFYTAPEARYMLHKGLDIWALGICLWACLTQTFPFVRAHATCHRYKMVLASMKLNDTYMCDTIYGLNGKKCSFSSDVKDLLDSMLCVDHKRRYTIQDIQTSIECMSVQCTEKMWCNNIKAEELGRKRRKLCGL